MLFTKDILAVDAYHTTKFRRKMPKDTLISEVKKPVYNTFGNCSAFQIFKIHRAASIITRTSLIINFAFRKVIDLHYYYS